MKTIAELQTPALLVDADGLEHNLTTMAAALPGARLRPHVKAHKCTALAQRQAAHGHRTFTCATIREMEGMAAAGLGRATCCSPTRCVDARRLGARSTRASPWRSTPTPTIDAAAAGGVREVRDRRQRRPAALRLRCRTTPAASPTSRARGPHGARRDGLRGPRRRRSTTGRRASSCATRRWSCCSPRTRDVGGDVISAGGTGTYDLQHLGERDPGRLVRADGHRLRQARPAVPAGALRCWPTVISVCARLRRRRLRPQGARHGPRQPERSTARTVWFCSDEHITFAPEPPLRVGDRVRVWPAHIDPTIAYHERMHVVSGEQVLDTWPVDLRGW